MINETITAIHGVNVGHVSDYEGGTGVTVIIFDKPAIGSVDVSGMATSTRQIDSLEIIHPGTSVHALCLAGGSAFGLDAAGGVVRYLEEKGVGLNLPTARLPVVPTAVIYDLSFMDSKARPSQAMAYNACMDASDAPVKQGTIGAGTGATCGKLRGVPNATKAGLGSSFVKGINDVGIGALVVANPFGDIIDENGNIIAGARTEKGFLNTNEAIISGEHRNNIGSTSNTTLCVLVTDAYLDKISALQVARMAGHGLSRHISPYNTPFDGDMVFCLSVGNKEAHPLHLGVVGARAAAEALRNAVMNACPLGGLPVCMEILG